MKWDEKFAEFRDCKKKSCSKIELTSRFLEVLTMMMMIICGMYKSEIQGNRKSEKKAFLNTTW